MPRRKPDPSPEPTEWERRWSKALSGAIVAELERLKALGATVSVHGVPAGHYTDTSISDGSFHSTHIGNDAAGTDPAASGAAA